MAQQSRSRYYETKRQKPAKQPQMAPGSICPLSRKKCLTKYCKLWDDDWGACALGSMSLYNQIRDAATDALVDIIAHYGLR